MSFFGGESRAIKLREAVFPHSSSTTLLTVAVSDCPPSRFSNRFLPIPRPLRIPPPPAHRTSLRWCRRSGNDWPHPRKCQRPVFGISDRPTIEKESAFFVPQFPLDESLQSGCFVVPNGVRLIELPTPAGCVLVHQTNVRASINTGNWLARAVVVADSHPCHFPKDFARHPGSRTRHRAPLVGAN